MLKSYQRDRGYWLELLEEGFGFLLQFVLVLIWYALWFTILFLVPLWLVSR